MPFSVSCRVLLCGGSLLLIVPVRALPAKTSAKPAAKTPAKVAAPALALSGWNYEMADEPLETRWSFRARQQNIKSGEARAVFGWKDAENFALLRATPTQIELWEVTEGKARKVGASVGGTGDLTLQIEANRARVLRDNALALEAILKLPGQSFGTQARGGYAWDAGDVQPAETVIFRDDFMRAQGPEDAEIPSQWEVSGQWKTSGTLGPKSDAALNPNPFVFRASQGNGQNESVARTGKWFWSDYAFSAAVRANAHENAPLVAGLEAFGDGAKTGLRGEIDFQNHVARLKIGDKILAQSAPFDTQSGQWHRVTLEPGPGVARLLVDGIERVRAENVPLAQGEIALRAQTGGANSVDFDDVRVGPPGQATGWGEGSLPERFQKDRLMKNWASAAAAWKRDASGVWWNTGDFFGASSVSLPVPALEADAGIQIALGAANRSTQTASTRLVVERAGDNVNFGFGTDKPTAVPLEQAKGKTLVVKSTPRNANEVVSEAFLDGKSVARRADKRVNSGINIGIAPLQNGAPLPAPTPRAVELTSETFERGGKAVIGVNITPVTPEIAREVGLAQASGAIIDNIEANAPALKSGLQIGDVVVGANDKTVTDVDSMRAAVGSVKAGQTVKIRVLRAPRDGSGIDWENTLAATPALLDYSFTSAPVDWRPARGRWEVSERWTCSPQWSFFAGSDAQSPLLWSRFATRGDWTLEAYLATPMDLARGERSPTDLDITVGGDGQDLASGYSFGFATDNRAKNTIWRGDAIALQKPFELPPGAGETHQDWFYVRLEKRQIGKAVRFKWSVNGREIATYTDDNPLPDGGHLAFWSANGGLSIARARLWTAGVATPPPSPWKPAPAIKEIANPLGNWSARGAGDEVSARVVPLAAEKEGTLQIINPQSGGDWTTYVTRQSFSPKLRPNLSWDYKMTSDVKLNLYAKIDGQWREVVWSGGASSEDKNQILGSIEAITDGAWHRANFDLLAALREKGLGEKTVEALAFAAPNQPYLRAGIGGNHLGASWELRDFGAPVLVAQTP